MDNAAAYSDQGIFGTQQWLHKSVLADQAEQAVRGLACAKAEGSLSDTLSLVRERADVIDKMASDVLARLEGPSPVLGSAKDGNIAKPSVRQAATNIIGPLDRAHHALSRVLSLL